jgi:dipeptide/tripeptide permease
MSKVAWMRISSAVWQYSTRAALGTVLGFIIGAAAAFRAAREGELPTANTGVLSDGLLGAQIGLLAGLLHHRLRRLRDRGRGAYYLSWSLSIGSACAVVMLPEAVSKQGWWEFAVVVALGLGGGLGLALFTRQGSGHKW